MISRLNDEHRIDPVRFGELTYPQVLAVLSRGKSNEAVDEVVRARKALADYRSGKFRWED